jgi:hypothetical protein
MSSGGFAGALISGGAEICVFELCEEAQIGSLAAPASA